MSTLTIAPGDEEDEPEDKKDITAGNVRDTYTAERLQVADPHKYEGILELLARGIPKSNIARDMHTHYYIVCNIEARCYPDVVRAKEMLSKKLLSAATASIDSAERRAANGKAGALDAKLLTEAWLNLNGEATQTISVEHSWPALSEFNRLKEAAGEVIEV